MIQKLKKRINFEVNLIEFVKRDGLNFLDIELPDTNLKSIEEKTKLISNIIDEIDKTNDNYYLNVFSSGTEKEIKLKDINLFIGKYLSIKSSKQYFEKNDWEGDLLENINEHIILKINNKGRIQKLQIEKKYIVYIKTTAKLRKDK
ncbi:ribosome assembly cofactor RimP [Mesomycoplasma moatsii]|uniref:ribosome assembly cofactor RimP n=1 Tax=Mesomycoplasma moatsii TaxID=171287 RepID=UPI0003B68DE0